MPPPSQPPAPKVQPRSVVSSVSILGGLLGLFMGALFAVIFLFCKPTITVEKRPEVTAPGAVYYVPGSKTKPSYWQQIRMAFYTPRRIKVTVNEDDLNKWAVSTLPLSELPPQSTAFFEFGVNGVPNFRIKDSELHVALNFDLKLAGGTLPILWQATGYFEKSIEGIFVFRTTKMSLGSLPIPHGLQATLLDQLVLRPFAKKPEAKPFTDMWQKLAWIKAQDDVLQVARVE